MSSIEHIILYLILFITFFLYSQYNKSKTSNSFIINSIIPILLFVFIEGSRYGRGNDYLSYKYRYEHLDILNEPQILFFTLMKFMHYLTFDYVGAFRTYAFIFIIGVIFFIRKSFNRIEAQWMYFFAICALLLKMEFMIRQYIAMPFIFCGIYFFFQKKWLQCILLVTIANLIHSGSLFAIPFILLSYLFLKKIVHFKYCIIALFLAYYIIPNGFFVNISTQILNSLHLDSFLATEHLNNYIEKSDRWLGEDSILTEAKQSILTKSFQFIFETSIIIVGYYALKARNNVIITCLYNITIIGFITCRLFHGYEIFHRMFDQLYIYWFVIIGYAFSAYFKKTLHKKNIYILCLIIICTYQLLFWGRYIFQHPNALFYWN